VYFWTKLRNIRHSRRNTFSQKIKTCKLRRVIVESKGYLLGHEPQKITGPSSMRSTTFKHETFFRGEFFIENSFIPKFMEIKWSSFIFWNNFKIKLTTHGSNLTFKIVSMREPRKIVEGGVCCNAPILWTCKFP
jgi:hypothetical protein